MQSDDGTGAGRRRGHAWAAFVVLVLVFGAGVAANARDEPRDTMAEIFAAMRYLLPLSLGDERFNDPAHRDQIEASLTLLARSAATLREHGTDRDETFAHLSRSLSRDAEDIHQRWKQGHHYEARYLVMRLTETCVACHSRLPVDDDSNLSAAFVREDAITTLPLDQRAKLEFATRQFGSALESYEKLFASDALPANDLDMFGFLDEYLELSIRVRQDPERAARTFERFRARGDLPAVLEREVGHWIGSLREMQGPPVSSTPIATADALIESARDRSRFADEREALVPYMQASGLLHGAIAKGIADKNERARAFHLLGIVEMQVGRSFWLSQAEAFLETSIRAAPGEPLARETYAMLEDYTIAGYTGSAGTDVPPDVHERLETLRQMIEAASPGSAAP